MADGKDDKTPPLGGGAGDDADALAGFDLSSLQESLGAMTGGMPGGAGGPDMSALGDLLGGMGGAVGAPAAGGAGGGLLEMAQQLANDPAFAQMASQLQGAMGPGGPMATGGPGGPGGSDGGGFNPQEYMQTMQKMMADPSFVQYSEKLYSSMMEDPMMKQVMTSMSDPTARQEMEEKMKSLREDPELADVMKEMEAGGPQAMMKYWNDPDVLSKIGKKMQGVMGMGPGAAGSIGASGDKVVVEEAGEAEEEEVDLLAAVSSSDVDAVKELVAAGADVNEKDEDGRSALHFACGYGEIECARILLEAGATVDILDATKNTPLHYAAGYGEKESCELLLEHKADKALKNDDKATASDIAKMNNHAELSDILKV